MTCENHTEYLKKSMDAANYEKLTALQNPKLHRFVAEAIEICKPDSVFVCSDSAEDIGYVREMAIKGGEEIPLATEGHTAHFDGMNDQARDKRVTKYLLSPGQSLGANINSIDREEGLAEMNGFLAGSMAGKEMLIRFFSLGPTHSEFSVSGVQITDSFYVGHSEDLLYRAGYEQFASIGDSTDFFRVLHSAGRLENNVSADEDKKRVYMDLDNEIVYSANTQYAGNTVGFKKLSLRLAINKADREGWLAEHMFVMGVHGPQDRVTYFTGAFPSFCGKTSTSMMTGETIIGDDLAYLRVIDGAVRAVNVESGIFGIIRNVNPEDDPLIWKVLNTPGEVIFSNILVADGKPYWAGSGIDAPDKGINYSGEWYAGKTDDKGNPIEFAHKNSRYTVRLNTLENRDPMADDPSGVPVGGVIYGGRDSDTWVPVQQSFDWAHGVLTMGACLESETTAATLGQEGVRSFQPMSNLDFVSIPLGRYLMNHINFIKDLDTPPTVFAVNYFIRGADGVYLTGMQAKRVWAKWMELRVHGEADAIRTPTGFIPKYEDLQRLFREVLDEEYPEDEYIEQFTLRIPENLAKIKRMERTYREDVTDTPQMLFDALNVQRERLLEAQKAHGDYIPPSVFAQG